MVTIRDISKRAGVSPATVSKALNGYSDINPETAERILAIAEEMNYLPNVAARSLKTNRNNMIGVLFEDDMKSGLTHEYFSAILNAAKEELERSGYDITFIHSKVVGKAAGYLQHARFRRCDGVLIANVDFNNPQVLSLVNSEIPTVTIDFSFDGKSSVLSDDINGGYMLTKYLLEQGHRRIAIITGEDTLVTRKRLNGFHRALREFGVTIPKEYIKQGRYHSRKTSKQAAKELLALKNPPTVIMFPDDYSYLGGLDIFEEKGMQIPQDISVTGYDGIPLAQVMRPKLTTYRQAAAAIGIRSAAKLVEIIEEGENCVPEQIMVTGGLLTGESVKRIQ